MEHRDRVARFGPGRLQAARGADGWRVVVADPSKATGDLVRDMIEVLTWMYAGRSGRRRARAVGAVTAAGHRPSGAS